MARSTNNASNNTPKTAKAAAAAAAAQAAAQATAKQKRTSFNLSSKLMLDKWKTLIGCVCLAIASYFGYLGYLETRVNTPFDNQKMVLRTGLDDPERYWGSYRPLTYFGMKTRDPHSLVMGLMWYTPSNLGHGGHGIRHWCEQGDKLDGYGWTHHDGRSFGVQEIQDLPFVLKTSFVKYPGGKQFGGDWTARISVKNTTRAWDRSISLIWYVALDERTNGHIKYVSDEKSPEPGVYGETQGLGEFQVRFHAVKGKILHKSYLSTVAPSLSKLKETVFAHFRAFADKRGNRFIGLPGEIISQNGIPTKGHEPNFIAIQITAEVDFTLDITYQSTSGFALGDSIPKPPTAREYTESLQAKLQEFDQRFEKAFQLRAKGYSLEEIRFAKSAFSNMIGGIGYFYGASRVQSVHTKNPVPYWKAPLYTSVPSRSFFPRGFLWDEGFHGLLISSWDLDIELDIICHWFDLLNVEGWIPREQILGVEALAKVPEEFVTQRNTNANPPTFFLTLRKLLTQHRQQLAVKGRLATLERLYPRLQAWFSWFNTTQRGDVLGTYLWRGRNATTLRELNPKSLSSGLDDFPRASHPTDRERHVDLRCWIALAASVMAELSTLLGKDDVKYYETASYLTDNTLLNRMHLDPYTERYADWGLHTDSVVLKVPPVTQKSAHSRIPPPQPEKQRFTLKQPDYKFVGTTFGYVNLFPLLLEQLEHDSPYLTKMLRDMRDPELLWTNYGLRSLSKHSPLYMKRNTEHDPPYWRGPIWININYLAVKALRHYGKIEGPNAAQARELYGELRENLVRNIFKQYQRTGYIWEQYDDTTGEGKGCNPFTGWSALVVLLMAEQY
ncbi:mannosyl-oligosaccharide glucosidase GCS1 [Scaptodrosophila lebanonensis]|uniref:Mannosyl-oligosaccharide glucosidase n=1 Tax=Drosophila lebanonensis TaxID=7225 RepID=A0A6J2TV15_DROLE|nr:mannosyl-oligosaccharide glucosidase GCS1 [Scaptodrosophila lebanonensis]